MNTQYTILSLNTMRINANLLGIDYHLRQLDFSSNYIPTLVFYAGSGRDLIKSFLDFYMSLTPEYNAVLRFNGAQWCIGIKMTDDLLAEWAKIQIMLSHNSDY